VLRTRLRVVGVSAAELHSNGEMTDRCSSTRFPELCRVGEASKGGARDLRDSCAFAPSSSSPSIGGEVQRATLFWVQRDREQPSHVMGLWRRGLSRQTRHGKSREDKSAWIRLEGRLKAFVTMSLPPVSLVRCIGTPCRKKHCSVESGRPPPIFVP
jgi:hypothetical protein